ncbi:neuronal PAS domain-containing protein 3 isoform X2 [Syngnathoides biaculeatus]|uniref:neuronal PAS domain-containing protein 3 isoform X2 n=1 Tax=Syngnathoides biaculeatus TaxID=300417 RepID=UPI002ADE7656|nr:neuronal PAS domain-containing protein 3 isoform X2 [Syngnathoides biaculeatus]
MAPTKASVQHEHARAQRDPYWERPANAGNCPAARPKTLHLAGGQQHTSSPWLQALRKEKSRDAARSRRGKENFEFYELAKMLPLPGAITSQLDKASIIRLTISYLKMRDFANQGDPPWNLRTEGPPPNTSVKAIGNQRRRTPSALASDIFEPHLGSHILQSLDGFVFALNKEGRFLYISETVSIYLGLSQVELTGSSVFDYVHPGDHAEVAEQLGMKLPPGRAADEDAGSSSASSTSRPETPEPAESGSPRPASPDGHLERSFFVRMKSTLTKRGVHIKSSGYKVIHVTGRLRIRMALTHARSVPNQVMGMVVVAHALPPPTVNEVRIDCQMFVTRVNMDLKIVYCENRISDYMDVSAADVVGKRCYQLIHAEDAEAIRQSHVELMNKGQCVTKYYRWIQRSAGYIWIQSSATIAINAKNASDKNVVWVNYVLSNHEYKDTPIDMGQMPSLPEKNSESSESSDSDCESKENAENNKLGQPERSENAQAETRRQQRHFAQSRRPSEREAKQPEERDASSNAESPESDDSPDASDAEAEDGAGTGMGGLHIKVEHYGEPEERVPLSQSSSSSSEEEEEERDEGEDAGAVEKRQRRKRRKVQKWRRTQSRKLRLSSATSGSAARAPDAAPAHLLAAGSPLSSVLKIKTEMSEPINFDNDSSIWNFPPNREISRNESPYSMTAKPAAPTPRKQGGSLQVPIPDAVLTPPATEGGARKPPYNGGSTPSALAPADPLSPPLSASPRDKQQGTPTAASSSSSSSSSLLCSGDLEALQRLQSANVVLPLVRRVAGTAATAGGTPPRVYTTGTIRYAPADVTLAVAPGSLVPNASVNFVDAPGFGLDPKTPMEMLYHHVHRLNMSAATTGSFAGSPAAGGGTAAQVPAAAANAFGAADGIFSALPFPVYTNGIQAERKED